VLLALLPAAAAASWIDDGALERQALAKRPTTARLFTVDLDLPAQKRWAPVYSDPMFANATQDIHNYFAANVPSWSIPILQKIAKDVRGHFQDYGEEMLGIAEALKAPLGEVVLVNLVYALEGVAGSDCTTSNTTGPCKKKQDGPGLCTSLVAEAASGQMWHGRNMDWNFPEVLRKYIFDVDFVRGGKPVFRGTTVVGLAGLLHGLKPGHFSISLNARDGGGSTLLNMLKLVGGKNRVCLHLLREVLDAEASFGAALQALSGTAIVEHAYFILGGAGPGEGAVVSRDRLRARDVYLLNQTRDGWFVLQTNYDHWTRPPAWDDRQGPGEAHLRALGQAGVGAAGLGEVLHAWPTFNNHTDITAVMGVSGGGSYRSTVWLDAAEAPARPLRLLV